MANAFLAAFHTALAIYENILVSTTVIHYITAPQILTLYFFWGGEGTSTKPKAEILKLNNVIIIIIVENRIFFL